MEFEVSAELVGIYLEDAREHLAVLDATLLAIERDGPSPEAVGSLLGPLHTLKGNSGMIGLIGVKDYVHRLEDAFTRIRDGSLALTPPVLQLLFEGATALREAVESMGAADRQERDLVPETTALDSLLAAPPAAGTAPAPARETPAPPREATVAESEAPATSSESRIDISADRSRVVSEPTPSIASRSALAPSKSR